MNQKIGKKIIALLTVFCMLFMSMPIFAAEIVVIKAEQLVDGILDLSTGEWQNTTIRIPSTISGITIKGEESTVYSGLNIEAENRSNELKVTIKDLKIDNGRIDIAKTTVDTTLIIEGTNRISANGEKAAIYVQAGKSLVIDAKDSEQSLEVIGGSNGGAGIGADYLTNNGAGNITIKNGKIMAQGQGGAAGIGQGRQPNGNPSTNINILGGIVTAKGSEGAAGIGGSNAGQIGNILISGGVVEAIGGNGGAGIGAGTKKCCDITIKDGATVSATGNGGGAGIGGGQAGEASVGEILIDGAIISAKGSNDGGAGIGGGNQGGFVTITIQETTEIDTIIEVAEGGRYASGIGVGCNGTGNELMITGGTIKKAIGGEGAAGIGGGYERGVDITIKSDDPNDKVVIEQAIGGNKGAGIGSGPKGNQEEIKIEDSLIRNAIGGDGGAGIGGGEGRSQTITITNSIIENAAGGTNAAGIGGGNGGKENLMITITGSKVYASGGTASGGSGLINDIGSGRGNSEGEEANGKVILTDSDAFLKNNMIRGLHDLSTCREVIFNLFDRQADNTLAPCTQNKVELKAVDNSNGILMDGEYEVQAGNKIYARIELGAVTSTNIDLDEVFHRYWFQYNTDKKIPMVGHPITSSSGWIIDATEIADVDEAGNTIILRHQINKIEMDIEFIPGTLNNSGVTVGNFDDDISGIIPFSVSCITFEIPKVTDPKFKKLEKVKVTLDFNSVSMKFDISKWQVGVFEKVIGTNKYIYNATLSEELKNNKVTQSGQKLILEYPVNITVDGQFKVAVYMDTEYFTGGTIPSLEQYKTNYVATNQELSIPLNYDIDIIVLTTQELNVPVVGIIQVNDVEVTENNKGDVNLNIPYKEITKIS